MRLLFVLANVYRFMLCKTQVILWVETSGLMIAWIYFVPNQRVKRIGKVNTRNSVGYDFLVINKFSTTTSTILFFYTYSIW